MEPVTTFTLIFIAIILLLIAEIENKVTVALLGALLVVYFGVSYGFFAIEDVYGMIDLETILFITASLLLFQSLSETGFFETLSTYIISMLRLGGAAVAYLLLILSTFFSMISVNYISILVMSEITLHIYGKAGLDPRKTIILEGILGNVGGLLLPISSIPGIIIAVEKGIGFSEFLRITPPLIALLTLITIVYFRYASRGEKLEKLYITRGHIQRLATSKMYKTLVIFVLFIVGVSLSGLTGFTPSFIAFFFVTVMFMFSGLNPNKVMSKVDWGIPFFVGGFAVIMNGLANAGFLEMLGSYVESMVVFFPAISIITLTVLSGVLSAFIDNVPVVLMLLPIIDSLSIGIPQKPMYWALLVGASIGGSMTYYGSVPILVALSKSEEMGYKVSTTLYTKVAVPLALIQLLVSSLYIYMLIFIGFI